MRPMSGDWARMGIHAGLQRGLLHERTSCVISVSIFRIVGVAKLRLAANTMRERRKKISQNTEKSRRGREQLPPAQHIQAARKGFACWQDQTRSCGDVAGSHWV